MIYKIFNKTTGKILAENTTIADTFIKRLCGLIPRSAIAKDEALLFYNAPSIHMFFMKFPIDLVFLDKNMKVVRVVKGLSPWKMAYCFGAFATIELHANQTSDVPTHNGDTLELLPIVG
ncbi:MAG: DUF192 domain-containing protein [Candidatus Omnitrophica bacterium]|nr:DUF192 domain-containing protein [Candidatus Omnitrophota bacterium]